MKAVVIALFATATALTLDSANAASFNCAKAKSKIEMAICADPELSKMDEILSISYAKALKSHPLPEYIKARQIDWLGSNEGCDPNNFTSCLKRKYQERLQQLMGTEDLMVFSSQPTFSYGRGDAVVEIWKAGDVWRMNIWGGFFIHELLTQEQKHPVFTGCEFNGVSKNLTDNSAATSHDGNTVAFALDGDKLTIPDGSKTCWGYGQLPRSFERVRTSAQVATCKLQEDCISAVPITACATPEQRDAVYTTISTFLDHQQRDQGMRFLAQMLTLKTCFIFPAKTQFHREAIPDFPDDVYAFTVKDHENYYYALKVTDLTSGTPLALNVPAPATGAANTVKCANDECITLLGVEACHDLNLTKYLRAQMDAAKSTPDKWAAIFNAHVQHANTECQFIPEGIHIVLLDSTSPPEADTYQKFILKSVPQQVFYSIFPLAVK